MRSDSVRIDRFRFSELRIPFKVAFRHASAERAATESVWIEAIAADGTTGSGESCPRSYVTGETIDSARAFVEAHDAELRRDVDGVDALQMWIASHRAAIDANPAAWCAVELALLDLFGKRAGVTVESLLSQPALAGDFRYTAVLGDASPAAFHAMAERYRQVGFTDFKVKLCGDAERDRAKLSVFDTWPEGSV